MWLVLSHQEPQTQYKSEIKEKNALTSGVFRWPEDQSKIG